MNITVLQKLGLEEVTFDPGTTIIKRGDKSQNVYVLIAGKVVMRVDDHEIAKVDSPGTILGEISVLLNTDPIADVICEERSSFYVVEGFMEFIHEHPDACVSVAQILACRLINMNNHFVVMREQLDEMQKNLADYVPVFPENYQGVE